MKKILFVVLLAGWALLSNGQNYPVIAKEYCDCLQKLKDTMNKEYQDIMIRVSKKNNLQDSFTAEMQALSIEKRKEFAGQLELLGTKIDSDDNEAGRCGIALDKKYEAYNDTPEKEKAFNKKMAEELKKNQNCEFFAAIVMFVLAFDEEE